VDRLRAHTAEIREIYEVRAALEGYSARLACLRATEDELAELAELRTEAANADLESDKRVDLNEHLHDSVLRFAHNGALLKQARTSRLFFFNRSVAQLYTRPTCGCPPNSTRRCWTPSWAGTPWPPSSRPASTSSTRSS